MAAAALGLGVEVARTCDQHSPMAPFAKDVVPPPRALVAWSPTAAVSPQATPLTRRTQLLAHVNPGGGYSADVFAHRGHAYLSSWVSRPSCPSLGVRVLDVRNPRRPRVVSTFGGAAADASVSGSWTEKTIVQHVETPAFSGELALTSFQACFPGGFQGFGLYDVTDPRNPRRLAVVRTDPRGVHETWLQANRGRAYVYAAIPYSELESSPDYNPQTRNATIPGKPDFRIFDVTNPQAPVQVAEWGAWRNLGTHPRNGVGAFSFNFAHSVIVNSAGTRAFVSYWDLGTLIFDVRNPAQPRLLGRTRFAAGEQGDAHSAALGRGGRLLIQTHEVAGGRPTLYDISRPARPVRLSVIRAPAAALRGVERPEPGRGFNDSVHDPKVRGNRAYFSWYAAGVLVADISNVRKPRVIAQFRPPNVRDPAMICGDRSACERIWGVFPSGNVAFASGMVGGLWVFRLR